MKKCSKCKQEFPETAEYFYRSKTNRGGLQNLCKGCSKQVAKDWRLVHPDAVRVYRKRDYLRQLELHPDFHKERYQKQKAILIQWQKDHPERKREIDRAYYQRHKKEIQLKRKKQRQKKKGK